MEIVILFFIAFFAGAIGILAPCTFPLIPAFLANIGLSAHGKLTKSALYFSLGIASMFTILGLAAGFFGSFLAEHKATLAIISGLVIFIFGIYVLFGITPREIKHPSAKTPWQSFGLGIVFSFAWSGCIGPVVAVILLLAINLSHTIMGGALLFVYALGVLFPLLILTGLINELPRDGRLWKIIKGKIISFNLFGSKKYIHSTNLVAGILFILLGIFLVCNSMFGFTTQFSSAWIYSIQDSLLNLVNITKIG
jgi:cytochrome c-type biogenesis protein